MGTILHLNAVGMMAEIEENHDLSLKGRPFVLINPKVASRAVIIDQSKLAHKEGIRTGMSLADAKRIVPELVLINARQELYQEADSILENIALSMTPLVERAGRGHLFIDLKGTARRLGNAEDATQKIRMEIIQKIGIKPVFALSSCKTASKVASRVFRPGGFISLADCEESALIRQQPAALLPGVGTVLESRLRILEIDTIGQIADLLPVQARAIAPQGNVLVTRAKCIDDSPVNPEPPEKRYISENIIFEPDTSNLDEIKKKIEKSSSKMAFCLRKNGTAFKKVVIKIAYTDKLKSSGMAKSKYCITNDYDARKLCFVALEHAITRRVRIRSIIISFSEIEASGPELDLFTPSEQKIAKLQNALDLIRGKFGQEAISRCF